MAVQNNRALADAVRSYIEQNPGLTQAVISANGGPSSTTMTKVLTGTGGLRDAIFGQLDRGLGWGDGYARAVWAGARMAPKQSTTSLAAWSDDDLLAEVRRRMQGGGSSVSTSEPGKKTPDGGGSVTPLRPKLDDNPEWAASAAYSEEPEGE